MVPSGGPRGTNVEPSSRPRGLQYQLSAHCSLALFSHCTWYALASCTVWTWGSPQRCKSLYGNCKTCTMNTIPQARYGLCGITKFTRGDGSAPSFKAKAAETRLLVPFGLKLADELNDKYNTEHILHALHCDVAVMGLYKCLGNWKGWCTYYGESVPKCM